MDYATLVGTEQDAGAIRQFVSDATVPATVILDLAEDWIYARLRDREMLSIDTSLTMSASSSTLTAPTDFLAPVAFNYTGTYKTTPLTLVPPHEIESEFQYDGDGNEITGKPSKYYVRGSTIQLNKEADAAYTTRLLYYARLTSLGNSNTTNFLTDRYSRLLVLVCGAFAYEWLKEEKQRDYWLQVAAGELHERKVQADLDFQYLAPLYTDHRSIA